MLPFLLRPTLRSTLPLTLGLSTATALNFSLPLHRPHLRHCDAVASTTTQRPRQRRFNSKTVRQISSGSLLGM